MLKDRKSFAILLADKEKNILAIVQNISLRKQIHFNKCKLNSDDDYSYVLYTESKDKYYVWDMARNKKIKLIWKDETDFYVIDFSNNTKGDIICYLSYENSKEGKIDGDVITPNFKQEFQKCKKVPLVNSQILDKKQPYNYEHFVFGIKLI